MKVGRFQIMSLLQAARAHVLGLPLDSAHSWGLNRAIFIAAAKRGFRGGTGTGGSGSKTGSPKQTDTYFLGDDMAFKTEKGGVLLFTIGGEVQTEEAFDRQVRSRFGPAFPTAWKEAIAYVKKFDREVLLSGGDFFRTVYRPVRDDWSERWTEESQTNGKIRRVQTLADPSRPKHTDSDGRRTRTTAGTGSMPRLRRRPASHERST
ncbi:MAG: hypothetical protein JRM80_04080 [Nitrososphaerota archaeon]|nr:hypothetical protein [Nitrososphaerota archaeon]